VVLWIVSDAADSAKHRGERREGYKKENCEEPDTSHGTLSP
jgi:hypothetical protein